MKRNAIKHFIILIFILFNYSFLLAEKTEEKSNPENPFLNINHMIGGTYRNPGLLYELRVFKRIMLFDTDNILFKNSHIDLGVINELAPSLNLIGGFIEIEPIVLLNIRFDIQQFSMFNPGILPGLGYYYYNDSSIPLSELDFSMDYRSSGKDKSGNEFNGTENYGFRFRNINRFQIMYWKIAFTNVTEISHIKFPAVADEQYYYDPISDAIHKIKDWNINNYMYLLYNLYKKSGSNLFIGTGWKFLHVFGTDYDNNRIGFIMIWTICSRLGFMEKPTLLITPLWYLDDPYKSTEKQYIPFIGIAFSFSTNWQ